MKSILINLGAHMRENPIIVWEMYESLEKEFLNYLEYVPLSPQHFNVWSYPLVNLFNNVGSSIDSFCKNALVCDSLNDFPDIDKIRKNYREHNMKTYREIFETKYKISNKQIFELKNFTLIMPFMEWHDVENAPEWWSRYTDIKHNRFEYKERATLKTTINALAGLFALFLSHKETLSTLIDLNLMHSQLTRDSYKPILIEGPPFSNLGPHRIYFKTALFGYVFANTEFPMDERDKIRILSPGYQGYGY
jgi:hypothetical protein